MLEKHLSLSARKKESHLHEVRREFSSLVTRLTFSREYQPSLLASPLQADNQVDNVRQHFYEVSLEYVFKVQEVQERKMFDFVEPVR